MQLLVLTASRLATRSGRGRSQERPFKFAVQLRPLQSEHGEPSLDHLAGALPLAGLPSISTLRCIASFSMAPLRYLLLDRAGLASFMASR